MDFLRRNRRNAVIPGEVAGVQGEDVRDPVCEHQRGKASIMDLLAQHMVPHDQIVPSSRAVVWFGERLKCRKQPAHVGGRRAEVEAHPVVLARPCCDHPVFGQHLRADEQALFVLHEVLHSQRADLPQGALLIASAQELVSMR